MSEYSFNNFLTKKSRETIKQLNIIQKLLESQGFNVSNFLDESSDVDEPYIFCGNTSNSESFGGIRIYKVGNSIAFRSQKEEKTHPYGKAYLLPIEELYNYFLEDLDSKKAAKELVKLVGNEIKKFFEQSAKAEKELFAGEFDKDSMVVRSAGMDYSSLIFNKAP